ncbi:MAG: RimK domain-containing protein ATP-grasp [Euryarchaeota archaeon]|nr:RimK domain-containing protein ATP-grasp [Euryarchaeota archaeon]MBU4139517.1 RimK domain-containing protein ATP-grasp [Euryarchaeota archaeon]
MILLWGLLQDRPLSAVYDALKRKGSNVIFLDQMKVLETQVELYVDSDIRGFLHTCDWTISLEAITAVYIRTYDWRQLPEIKKGGYGSPAWNHAMLLEDVLSSWLEITPALVVNRLSAMSSNNSKPYQASQIRAFGFGIPDTLITTDPSAVLEFLERHGEVIYKSISGVRSIVSRLTKETLCRLDDILWCPTQFQEYIPGNDYRVHVVGDDIFPCEIVSEADDYRYAASKGAGITVRPCEIPQDCIDRCRALSKATGLIFAGIDLRFTPEAKWYCFEVNPSPGFTYYQNMTDQPIADAVARLLVKGAGNYS